MINYNQLNNVSVRGGFSDRNGLKTENTEIQLNRLDERSRVAICNEINGQIEDVFIRLSEESKYWFWSSILKNVYQQVIDPIDILDDYNMIRAIDKTILEADYDSALTVTEYVVSLLCSLKEDIYIEFDPAEDFNVVFEKEYVGYRFINGQLTPITDETELQSVEEAVKSNDDNVSQHFDKALRFLSDRDNPDYANSIKESISAVEAMCSTINGKAATLGDALKSLEGNDVNIHPALKDAFQKLYGYASDAKGVRHAGQIGGKNATFAEAKFMLVVCAAFVNYLKGCLAATGA